MHVLESEHIPKLEVLGPILLNHHETSNDIRGRKRKELLVYLLEARMIGKPELRREHLLEMLYPESTREQAENALKNLSFQIRSSLGESAIRTNARSCALDAVGSDAEIFLETRDTKLWRGPYLQHAGFEGHDSHLVAEALYRALLEAAQALFAQDPREAARCAQIALQADPYNHTALRLELQAWQVLGQLERCNRVYERTRITFEEMGVDLPERWMKYLTHHKLEL